MRRSEIRKICAEFAPEKIYQDVVALGSRFAGLTPAERQFVAAAVKRGVKGMHRSGWPDFLVELESGRSIGVEVKAPGDSLRPNQISMFEALERAGLQVFIWRPKHAERLVHWRRHLHVRRFGEPNQAASAAQDESNWPINRKR